MVVLLLLSILMVPGLWADSAPWYHNAVIYQLYPRSFQDSDGDGIGDLNGVLQRVDYLASLGIDAVWFSPVYPSPNEDFGYDISDFEDINPEYGTLQVFDEIIAQLKKRGIKVLLDFVPNHSSTEHRWFKQSEIRNDTVEKYSDFYVWRDPKGFDSQGKPIPPNNWLGVINTGSAWEWNVKRKQFYLHNFLVHQADLNYANPQVLDRMSEVLKFWMRRGVAGFRVDAISWIWEDQRFKDEPKSNEYNPNKPNEYNNLYHIYTMDQPQNLGVVKAWRKAIDEYSRAMGDKDERVMILESYSDISMLIKYYGTEKEPGATFPFNFILLFQNKYAKASEWAESINNYFKAIGSHWPNWVLGNHDQFRVATRWGPEWVDILNMIMMTLKGTAVTYYGEEIGLQNSLVRWDQTVDVQGIVAGEKDFPSRSRDFERSPMPWNASNMAGFTNASSSWLPLTPDYWRVNVKQQEADERSHLKVYKQLVKLRKGMTLTYGDCVVSGTDDQIFYVVRTQAENPTIITAVNFGDQPNIANLHQIRKGLPDKVKLLVSSINYPDYKKEILLADSIFLPPKSGVVVDTSN